MWGRLLTCGRLSIGLLEPSEICFRPGIESWPIDNRPDPEGTPANLPHKRDASLVDLLLHLGKRKQELRELLLVLIVRDGGFLIFQCVYRLFELFFAVQ
jgi:hypothetical protein